MIRIATVALALGLAACGSSNPATHFKATMNAANEVASVAVSSSGTGTADYTVDGGTVSYTVTFTGLTANATAGHIHVGPAGVNGGVTVPFTVPSPGTKAGTISGSFTAANVAVASTSDGGMGVDAGDYNGLLQLMRAGDTYTNIHTSTYPAGEIRGQNQPQ
jgi:hypothetical protein